MLPFRRTLTASLTALLFVGSVAESAYAADLNAVGKEANALGKSLSANASADSPAYSNGKLSFKAGNTTVTIEDSDLIPAGVGGTVKYLNSEEDFEKIRNFVKNKDKTGLKEASGLFKDRTFTASESQSDEIEARVYAIAAGLARTIRDDYSEAEFLQSTAEVVKDIDGAMNGLVECDSSSVMNKTTKTVRVPKLKQCQQVLDQSADCTARHDYIAKADGTVENDVWTPASCVNGAQAVKDAFASGKVVCTEMPALTNGCLKVGSTSVCESAFAQSPINGISPFCKAVSVKASYSYYKGDTGCWMTVTGYDDEGNALYTQVCGGANTGGNLDTCAKYREDPQCKFVSRTCTRGAQGASGNCYVTDEVYDCGYDIEIPQVQADTEYACSGAACLGENCVDVDRTYSTDFTKLSTALSAAQQMSLDMTCTGKDTNGRPSTDPTKSCQLFIGKTSSCGTSVGGYQDCCNAPSDTGPGTGEYLQLVLAAQRTRALNLTTQNASSKRLQQSTSGGNPVYEAVATEIAGQFGEAKGDAAAVVETGVRWLSKPFSSAVDNVYGETDYLDMPVRNYKTWASETMSGHLQNKMVDILQEAGYGGTQAHLSDTALNSVRHTAANASVALETGTDSVLDAADRIFAAYQTANLIMQETEYKCMRSDYETISRRDVGNCHYIGSYCQKDGNGNACVTKEQVYCCYESPLSRMMAEYLKAYYSDRYGSAYGWGTPQNPKCGGFTISQVERVDLSKVDLDEWTGLLAEASVTPNSTDISTLTGRGSLNDWTGSRGDVTARSTTKLSGMQVDALRVEAQRCIELELGNGVKVRSGCAGDSAGDLECRKNSALVDCEDLAYNNSLQDLLNHPLTNEDYYNEGFRCTQGSTSIDCSSLYTQEAYWRALEEYARIIGGTTYLHRYVCLDSKGIHHQSICENAMMKNYCECHPGEFICQDGNKVIPCETLGATVNRCECLDGLCETNCPNGGVPSGLEDNPDHVCTPATCPYGSMEFMELKCDKTICPYG